MDNTIFSVKDINTYIKGVLSNDENLKYFYVKGEISNLKIATTGHIYFSLKDDESLINAVMFNGYTNKLTFVPKNGDEVVLLASVDVYVPRGSYQLYVTEMNLNGQGNILLELEKLKKKLQAEGLFDESRKRPINIYPKAIGIITAKNSAAIKDLLFNLKRRYPIADIYVFYSAVQGENAPNELLKAFIKSQSYPLDTLIIGRGGGASEDLSAFNDETLVRAIANSKMPVIAAVGHEIDFTLVDYVADKRASTPTGAAELATIDQREVIQNVSYIIEDIKNCLNNKVVDLKETISEYKEELKHNLLNKIDNYKTKLSGLVKELLALNPKSVLNRGYAIIEDSSKNTITDVNNIKVEDEINITMSNGKLITKVKEIIHG